VDLRSSFAVLVALATSCQPAAVPERQAPDSARSATLAPDTSWVRRSALYELFVRDFSPGGDFRGVVGGLDRVAAAGADVIWLMPIHPVGETRRKGTLGSPYAARDYYAINPAFGTVDDFRVLVAAVHDRGMKLILDWVPNHTAPDAVWVTEHPEFYVQDEHGQPSVPRDEQGQLTDWTDVVQLDYENPATRQAMVAAMRYWLQEFEIDGFRMDVAGFVSDTFWREAIPALRASVARPILLLAEWGDLDMHALGFDLTYAWDTYARLKEVWRGAGGTWFVEEERADLEGMPPGGARLRFTTNHDETAWDQPPIVLFGGPAGARAAFVAMALLPGRPLLYNGQEIESPQVLRLFERDPIVWDRSGARDATAFYARVIELARTDSAFLSGAFEPVETTAPDDVIAYRRGDAVVLVNPRPRPVQIGLPGEDLDGFRDLLGGGLPPGRALALPAFGTMVLARRAP